MPCKEAADPSTGGDPGTGDDPVGAGKLFIYNDSAEQVVGVGRQVIFVVGAIPANHVAPVTFDYTTANGSAIAGTHYSAKSGTGSIAVGDSSTEIAITVREPAAASGTTKTFTVTISSPSAGITIADAVATGTIVYDPNDPDGGGGGGGGTGPTWGRTTYQSVSLAQVPVYDQLRSIEDASEVGSCSGDIANSGCTGYSAALMMSIFEWKLRHIVRSFDANKLLCDAGYPCSGGVPGTGAFFDGTVADWIRDHNIKRCADSVTRSIDSWRELQSLGPSYGTISQRYQQFLVQIKKGLVKHHAVMCSMMWYNDWNSTNMRSRKAMSKVGSWPTALIGHSMVIVGWNDHVDNTIGGAFKVQSSHGKRWGTGGRAWMPYSFIRDTFTSGGRNRSSNNHTTTPWMKLSIYIP